MEDWKARQAARQVAAQALQAANPWLVPVGGKVDSLIAASKNVRIELKRAFPKVKFSVKTERYSGGDSLRVRWTDGPTAEQVDAIVQKYSAGSFDGMTDCYNYEASAWTDAFGDAKYVFSNRDDSDAALESAIRTVKAQYAGNLSDLGMADVTVEAYRKGDYYRVDLMKSGSDYWSLANVIRNTASKRTWALDQTPKAAAMQEADGVAA